MDAAVNRDLFCEKLNALIAKKKDNCFYFSREKYLKIMSEVIAAKTKCISPLDYRRVKRFDILKIKDEEKLIVPIKPGETKIQYYVTSDELYNILAEAHIKTGHGRRTRMLKELQVKYKNITYESVKLYLRLCKHCQMKQGPPKKEGKLKSRWKALRDTFRQELKKSTQPTSWAFYEEMSFIKSHLKSRQFRQDWDEDLQEGTVVKTEEPEELILVDEFKEEQPDPSTDQVQASETVEEPSSMEVELNGDNHFPIQPIENDDDYHFLMSFLPEMRKLEPRKKILLRIKMMELLYKEMF